MARRKFNEAGQTAEKTTWNKAKTRKWKMTYELVEVKPPKKRKAKASKPKKTSKPATAKPARKTGKAKPKASAKRRKKAAG